MIDRSGSQNGLLINPAGPTEVSGADGSLLLDPSVQGRAGFARTAVDLVFVIDTTGSMSDKIAGLVASCTTFADRFAAQDLDWRIALVAFGDLTVRGDRIMASGYTHDITRVHRELGALPPNSGGGNDGESSLEAIEKMIGLGARADALRLAILLTDEPPLDHRGAKLASVLGQLTRAKILTFTVAPDLPAYRRIAAETGGRWFPIAAGSDFSSILDMFARVVASVTATVSQIQLEAGGDVERYLALPAGRREGR